MQNEVFLNNDGIIEVYVVGDQDVGSINAMGQEIVRLSRQVQAAGKPVLVLDDLSRMQKVDREGRKRVVALGKELPYDRLAMVGHNNILRVGSNLMFQAMGKGDSIRYFDSRDEAISWLKSVATKNPA